MAKLVIFTLLHGLSSETVCNVGHEDECKEETKCQVGFPLLHDAVQQHNVKPNVRNDRPNRRDREHSRVLHFLDALRCFVFSKLLLGSFIVGLVDGVNGNAGDDEEVKGS